MEKQSKRTLNGKKVVIMGGSSGIGLATARAAATEGAQVVIVSSNQQRINEALLQLPEGSIGQAVDLSNEQQVKAFFENNGHYDHLIYTAGENLILNLLNDTQLEQARQFYTLRYWGAVASVKYGAPYINTGGSITLTSGIAANRPGKGWWLGSSICAAMEGFMRGMAIELAPIRVNIVSPGVVRTNLWSNMPDTEREQFYQNIGDTLPVERVGDADDIAQTYIYLMKQRFGTGQVVIVDGGAVLV
jgi:NAD(P)-dependent dehydrogenase (short-subunit alcohol dehydrogenase family)